MQDFFLKTIIASTIMLATNVYALPKDKCTTWIAYIDGCMQYADLNEPGVSYSGYFKYGLRQGEHIRYEDGVKIKEITYINSVANGPYKEYDKGVLKSIYTFVNNRANGPAESYYSNGNIRTKSYYKDGYVDGREIEYGLDGNIREISEYKKGLLVTMEKYEGNISNLILKGNVEECALFNKCKNYNQVCGDNIPDYIDDDNMSLVSVPNINQINNDYVGKNNKVIVSKHRRFKTLSNYNSQIYSYKRCNTINDRENGCIDYLEDKIDENTKRIRALTYNKGKLSGPAYVYESNGTLIEQYRLKNNVMHGDYFKYHKNGNLHIKANYSYGFLSEIYAEFDENNNIIVLREMQDGKPYGIEREYYKNGTVKYENNYNFDNIKDGLQSSYYESGKVKERSIYRLGELIGDIEGFRENGSILYRARYEDDKNILRYVYFDDESKPKFTLFKKDGETYPFKGFLESGEPLPENDLNNFNLSKINQ